MHQLQPQVRYATPSDVPELVRLRSVMWRSMGLTEPHGWEEGCASVLLAWLKEGTGVAAVAEDPARPGVLVAGGVGSVDQRLPGVSSPTGRYGYVASMVTEEAFRRRGLGSAVLALLLDWFRSVGVPVVDLHATADGEPVYRAAGFADHAQIGLRWRSA